MPTLLKETVSVPPPGRWDWNDETQRLEFIHFNNPLEIKEKRKKTKTSCYQEHFRKHLVRISQCQSSVSGGSSGLRKTVGPAELHAYTSAVRNSQSDLVTIEDIKKVAVSLVHAKEAYPIPLCFLTMIKSRDLDKFLVGLLLYLHCHWQRKALAERPKSVMIVQSVMERQMMAEAIAKVELAKKHLALCYSYLVLGTDLSQQHHMACGRNRVSSTYRDRQLFECLYSFFCYVAWVTFGRRNLKDIQAEIGSLLRSDTFNPALMAEENEEDDEQGIIQKEMQLGTEKPTRTVRKNRKSRRWPALSCMLTQRSPVLLSLLPSTREKAPHLFQSSGLCKQQKNHLIDTDVLMEELSQQLASCRFGILGMSLSQFKYNTLMPCGAKKETGETDDEDSDDDDYENENLAVHVKGRKASVKYQRSTTTAGKRSDLSCAHTVTSRATTEAVSSDVD